MASQIHRVSLIERYFLVAYNLGASDSEKQASAEVKKRRKGLKDYFVSLQVPHDKILG
jgi:hypothetical protein